MHVVIVMTHGPFFQNIAEVGQPPGQGNSRHTIHLDRTAAGDYSPVVINADVHNRGLNPTLQPAQTGPLRTQYDVIDFSQTQTCASPVSLPRDANNILYQGNLQTQPGDGSCLFHCLTRVLRSLEPPIPHFPEKLLTLIARITALDTS